MLDLTRYDADLKRDIAAAVAEVFASGRFVLGPANEAFEKALAGELGVRHALGVSSGTDALLVALMALGVGPGRRGRDVALHASSRRPVSSRG